MISKKAIGPVVAMALLIVTTVLAVVAFQTWYGTYSSDILSNSESKEDGVSTTKIDSVFDDYLYFRNGKDEQITVTSVKVGGYDCSVTETNVSAGAVAEFDISSCKANLTTARVEAAVIATDAIYSAFVYLSDVSESSSVTVGDLTMTFRASSSCNGGEVKLYGLYNLSNGHADNYTNTNGNYSACLSTSGEYTLGNACTGTYQRLFYLGNGSNTHIWIDNESAYEPYAGYYTWQEACVSSSGGTLDLLYSNSDPGGGYLCVGSFLQNDTYGGVVGNCSAHTNKTWISLS